MRSPNNPYTFEAQIRDITDHASSTMDAESGATVLTDELHPNALQNYSAIRIYVTDTHDAGYDIDLQHTRPGDETFSEAVTAATVSVASGEDHVTATLEPPVGRFQFVTRTGALGSAPTTGSVQVDVVTQA